MIKHKTFQVNYPLPLTDLHQNFGTRQTVNASSHSLYHSDDSANDEGVEGSVMSLTVSYTHLDVYKRQGLGGAGWGISATLSLVMGAGKGARLSRS